MGVFNKIGHTISRGFSALEERNHRQAQLNRIRAALKREERAAQLEYTALGRYYYANLRDPSNEVTEAHCKELDKIETRMNAAIDQLERYYAELAKAKSARTEEVTLDDVTCTETQEKAVEAVKNMATQVGEKVKSAVADTQTAAKETAEQVSDKVLQTVEDAAKTVSEKADDVADAAAQLRNKEEQEPEQMDYPDQAADPQENDDLPFAD